LQEKKRIDYDERKKAAQQTAQIKSQIRQYEDELARKRMQAEHEAQRMRNQELVKMQEESGIRLEQIRRRIEEEIQEQRRRTEEEIANIDRETAKQKAMAEAEAAVYEKKASLEVTRRLLIDQLNADREKWVQVINTTFEHIGGIPDQQKISSTYRDFLLYYYFLWATGLRNNSAFLSKFFSFYSPFLLFCSPFALCCCCFAFLWLGVLLSFLLFGLVFYHPSFPPFLFTLVFVSVFRLMWFHL
jgi:hypothetical protein